MSRAAIFSFMPILTKIDYNEQVGQGKKLGDKDDVVRLIWYELLYQGWLSVRSQV